MPSFRILALTVATLACFAANSLLCRAALRPRLVDPATFTLHLAIGYGSAAGFTETIRPSWLRKITPCDMELKRMR